MMTEENSVEHSGDDVCEVASAGARTGQNISL